MSYLPADFDREAVRRWGFAEFVKRAWPVVEPAPLIWGWHLDAICEHLTAVTKREIRELVINQPPGTSKSLVASVLWPAWVWTLDPSFRWLAASYSDKVVLRDARKCRSLVTSPWFKARWPQVQVPKDATASTAVTDWYTTAGGMRYSSTVAGQWTGQHGDCLVTDDPLDPSGADLASGVELERALRWWHETMPTRFRDQRTRTMVTVMQRLHERDLSAEMVREGATVLCLPMRYDPSHPQVFTRDPRKVPGELLCPTRFPEDVVKSLEVALGPRATASQFGQRPAPEQGGVFKRAWLEHYWTELPEGMTLTQSWDLTFKATTDGSFVVGQLWGQKGADFYLIEQVRGRWGFNDTCTEIEAMSTRWPKCLRKLIEDKANGPAVTDALKGSISGILLVTPEGGKVARAHAVEPLFAAGNVRLPHPTDARYPDGRRGAPWVPGFQHELSTFPNALTDDQTDTATQALNHLAPRKAARLVAAMGNVFKKPEQTP